MSRFKPLCRVSLVTLAASALAGCAGFMVGQPTPVPAGGPLGVPEPTATQIGVGANPTPSAPRMNPFVAQVRPLGAGTSSNPYGWLEEVHSKRARRWILVENRATAKALGALPQRAGILERLGQGGGQHPAASGDVVERVTYLAFDGTRLPMQIAHRRGLVRDGNRPTLLTVYPASKPAPGPLLQPLVSAWLAMGGVYARAQVRDDLASVPAAADAASPGDRSIALNDLFAAAQSLFDQRYTRRARLGVYGHGYAGLLAGAALTQRPDLFGVALPSGAWARYRAISSGTCFPPTLIVTAERGGTIRPWQGYELAAALQAKQICAGPILIRIEGDKVPQTAADRRERIADELAFAAKWLGVPAHDATP